MDSFVYWARFIVPSFPISPLSLFFFFPFPSLSSSQFVIFYFYFRFLFFAASPRTPPMPLKLSHRASSDSDQVRLPDPMDQGPATVFGSIRRVFSFLKHQPESSSTENLNNTTSAPVDPLGFTALSCPDFPPPLNINDIMGQIDAVEPSHIRPTYSCTRPRLPDNWRFPDSNMADTTDPDLSKSQTLPFLRTVSSASKTPSLANSTSDYSSDASLYSEPRSMPASPSVQLSASPFYLPDSPAPLTWTQPSSIDGDSESTIANSPPPLAFGPAIHKSRIYNCESIFTESAVSLSDVAVPAPLNIARQPTLTRRERGPLPPPPPPPRTDSVLLDLAEFDFRPVSIPPPIPPRSAFRNQSVRRDRPVVRRPRAAHGDAENEDESRDKITDLVPPRNKSRLSDTPGDKTIQIPTSRYLSAKEHALSRTPCISDLPPAVRRKLDSQGTFRLIPLSSPSSIPTGDSHPSNRRYDFDTRTGKPAPPVESMSVRDMTVRLSQVIGLPTSRSSSSASSVRAPSGEWVRSEKSRKMTSLHF